MISQVELLPCRRRCRHLSLALPLGPVRQVVGVGGLQPRHPHHLRPVLQQHLLQLAVAQQHLLLGAPGAIRRLRHLRVQRPGVRGWVMINIKSVVVCVVRVIVSSERAWLVG